MSAISNISMIRQPSSTRTADGVDEHGRTPLHHAALISKKEEVSQLLNAGAEVNARDRSQNTPLHLALLGTPPSSEVVEILLEAGAEINARNELGRTPLHMAVLSIFDIRKLIPILLSHGANPKSRDSDEKTPVELFFSAATRGHFLNLLPFKEAGVEIPQQRLDISLYWNAYYGTNYIPHLLKLGADIHAVDKEGNTPLHKVIQSLYDNQRSNWTQFYYNQSGQIRVISQLCLAGANLDKKNNSEQSPRNLIEEIPNEKFRNLIVSKL